MSAQNVRVSALALSWATGMGFSLSALAHASDVSAALLESGAELDYRQAQQLWAGLEKLSGDPYVGLAAGAQVRIDQMGVVGPAIMHAPNVGAAIEVVARLLSLLIRNADVEHVDTRTFGGLRYRAPEPGTRHGADAIFAAVLSLLRDGSGSRIAPATIELQAAAPLDPDVYVRSFDVRPTWGAPANALLFARADLALKMRGAAPAVSELLVEHAPVLIAKERGATAFDLELERAFLAAHRAGGASLASVAASMKLSARTLQRRLTERGLTFAEWRAELLRRRAEELLADDSRTIEAIADELGYASRASFERAYARWHGRTPAAVRSARKR
jgi:AraC-like DNA-binding protein